MTRTATALFGLLAAALAGSIVWQYGPTEIADETPLAPRQASTGPSSRPVASGRAAELTATILARPLMSPTRRPPPPARVSTPETDLPRLTGIIISPDGRSALFAGKPRALVVPEGGRVGDYTVQQIAPGMVTLNGPVGLVALRPSFDANRPAVATLVPSGLPLLPALAGDPADALPDAPGALPFERQSAPSGLDIVRNLARPPAPAR